MLPGCKFLLCFKETETGIHKKKTMNYGSGFIRKTQTKSLDPTLNISKWSLYVNECLDLSHNLIKLLIYYPFIVPSVSSYIKWGIYVEILDDLSNFYL